MKWENFIAEKIRKQNRNRFSAVVMPIAIGSIALGLAVTIISFSIFSGFKAHILEKLFAMSGHISVSKFDLNQSSESIPVSTQNLIYTQATKIDKINHIQLFVTKTALLKSDEEVAGVMLKGIDKKSHLVKEKLLKEGQFLTLEDSTPKQEMLISKQLANKISAKIGDELIVFFVQNPPRYRKLKIVGLFQTDIEEFDEYVVYCDYRILQQLNHWQDTLVSGFELNVRDFDLLDETFDKVYDEMSYDLQASKITDTYRHFFDWFIMLNRNVLIFMVVILFVACFNVISVLLIMVTERTEMIGILKSLGANNWQIQKIFFINGLSLILKGLFWGNVIALGFGFLQSQYKIIPLDPRNYYMDSVPFAFDWGFIIIANILMTILIAIVLSLPVYFISKIEPIKAIRFD
jgi:lipoprotein-releasing system permease protein